MSHTVVVIHDPDPNIVATAVATITTAVGDRPLSVHPIVVEDERDVDAVIEALLVEYNLNDNERAQVWLDDQGLTRKQIAAHLGLSVVSVTVYWRFVYEKIGVRNRSALRTWLKTLRRELTSGMVNQRVVSG